MDLSTIPLPDSKAGLTITSHTGPFPTARTWAPGIVHVDPENGGRMDRVTVQCSVCYRTATGRSMTAVVILGHWDFHPDPGERGHVRYRRCPDCRAAHRHPAEQLDMLALLEGTTS